MCKVSLESEGKMQLQFEKRGGLLPVVVQDADNLQILMLGYANIEAWRETLHSGMATFWSTSRKELWTKGKTSGDFLLVQEVLVDCDQDAIIYKVKRKGGTCHTKNKNGETRTSCFYRRFNKESNKLEFISGIEE